MSSADGDNIQDLYLKLMARGRAVPVDFSDDGTHKEKELGLLKEILSSVLRYTSRIQDHEYAGRVNPDRVRLTVFPSAKVQAATTWLDPFHVIGINRGLMLFVYRVARVLAPYIIDPPEDPRPRTEESAERLGTLIDWMASPLAAPWISADWKVGPRAARTAENIAQASERFVIAHEVAHVLLGHRIQRAPGQAAVGVTIESLDERESDQEIAADASGLILTIDSMTTDGLAAEAAAVGVFFFLWCLAIAEDVGAIDPGQTHQSAQLRDQLLRTAVQMKYGASAGAVLSWADDVTAKVSFLRAGAYQHRNVMAVQAQAALNEEFGQRPAIHGPDRDLEADYQFLRKMHDLLDRSPNVVLRALEENLLDAQDLARHTKAAASPAGLRQDDAYRRHTLAHFVARNLPPEMAAAIGVETFPVR